MSWFALPLPSSFVPPLLRPLRPTGTTAGPPEQAFPSVMKCHVPPRPVTEPPAAAPWSRGVNTQYRKYCWKGKPKRTHPDDTFSVLNEPDVAV